MMLWHGFCGVACDVTPSTSPPGGFDPADTPQIVLLTFDDSVTTASVELVQQVLTNHFNPNGDAIKATFFVALNVGYDFYAIRQLYDAGHEVALHTMSHQTGTNSSLARWRQEIAGEKRTLASLSGIPPDDLNGFRAPRLQPNDSVFRVLKEREFRYDSSFRESLSGLSTAPSNMIWPYTLDHGLAQVASPEYMPATNYPGLFEIPLWVQFSNTTAVSVTDLPRTLTSNEVVELLKTNFLARYHGNRAPYGIFLHATWSSQWLSDPTNSAWRIGAINEFIDWALAQPDTWFITCNDLVDFMLDPVPASAASTHPSFMTPVRTPFPTSEVIRCRLPDSDIFYSCGVYPPAAPSYTNAYLGHTPMDGGKVMLNVISQSVEKAWCVMAVSNDTPHQVYDWTISFKLEGGEVDALYDAVWTQTGENVSAVARSYNRAISPADAHLIYFRVALSDDEVKFEHSSISLTGLGPQPIRLNIEPLNNPSRWHLTWNDNAHIYNVECSTNLLDHQGWTVITNELCQPEITEPHVDGVPHFYRVKGTIY